MQERVDEAVSLSLEGVCKDCSDDYGTGWRIRSEARIIEGTAQVADEAEKRCIAIADSAFEKLKQSVISFCATAANEMAKVGDNIPRVLRGAIERARLTTPQEQRKALVEARESAPPPLMST
jgi:hypothetical protein